MESCLDSAKTGSYAASDESVCHWVQTAAKYAREPCVGVDGSIMVDVEEVYLTGRALFDAPSVAAAIAKPLLAENFAVFKLLREKHTIKAFPGMKYAEYVDHIQQRLIDFQDAYPMVAKWCDPHFAVVLPPGGWHIPLPTPGGPTVADIVASTPGPIVANTVADKGLTKERQQRAATCFLFPMAKRISMLSSRLCVNITAQRLTVQL